MRTGIRDAATGWHEVSMPCGCTQNSYESFKLSSERTEENPHTYTRHWNCTPLSSGCVWLSIFDGRDCIFLGRIDWINAACACDEFIETQMRTIQERFVESEEAKPLEPKRVENQSPTNPTTAWERKLAQPIWGCRCDEHFWNLRNFVKAPQLQPEAFTTRKIFWKIIWHKGRYNFAHDLLERW